MRRSAAVGGPAAGHYPNAWKPGHPHPLPLLHLWSRWGAAVEGHAASAMLCTPQCNRTHHIAAILPPSFSPRHRQCPNLVQPLHMRFTWCVLFVEPSSVMSLNDAALLLLTYTHTRTNTQTSSAPQIRCTLARATVETLVFAVPAAQIHLLALSPLTTLPSPASQYFRCVSTRMRTCPVVACFLVQLHVFMLSHTHTHTHTHTICQARSVPLQLSMHSHLSSRVCAGDYA